MALLAACPAKDKDERVTPCDNVSEREVARGCASYANWSGCHEQCRRTMLRRNEQTAAAAALPSSALHSFLPEQTGGRPGNRPNPASQANFAGSGSARPFFGERSPRH